MIERRMIKMDLDKADEELRIDANQISEQDIDKMEDDWDRKQELLQETREEPFWNWVNSLTYEELIEETYCDKEEFISSHKDALMESFNDLD
jgi:hypothetical protein